MQPVKRTLRIIRDFKRPTVFSIYGTACLNIFILLLFPLLAQLWLNDQVSYDLQVGDNTQKLIQDYVGWYKQPRITSSAWREQESYINSSTYHQSHFNNVYTISMCYMLYNWQETYAQVNAIVCLMIRFTYSIAQLLLLKYGWKRLIVFFFVCFLLNLHLILGGWSFLQLLYAQFQNVIKWIDSKLHDATHSLGLTLPVSQRTIHPFTSGKQPPYYLYTFNRYPQEDVRLTCEYLVVSLKDALPIYKKASWRKNGSPVSFSDRMYVNVSINYINETYGQILNIARYSVISTLSIEMIADEDFGSYTCEYYDPMQIFPRPGPRMDEGYGEKVHGRPHFPDPACKCQPQGRQENFRSHEVDGQINDFEDPIQQRSVETWQTDLFQCFSEFRIQKIESQTVELRLNPGSVLVDGAVYTSLGDLTELEYDVTFSNEDSSRDNCCSKLVMLYWGFFRKGTLTTPPFTRTLISGNSKYFYRYQCLCSHSYGNKQFTFSRKYFNHTTGTYDMTEIVYPLKLQIIPTVTFPCSANNTTESNHFQTTCWDEQPSDTRISQICSQFLSFLDNTLNLILFCDTLISYGLVFAVIVFVSFVPLSLHQRCVRPLMTACLTLGRRETSLVALTGESLTYNIPLVDQSNYLHPDDYHYQIFLSYDETKEFDLMIAQFIKAFLLNSKLSVFEFNSDVPFGQPMLQAIGEAIDKSYRFVVIASTGYMENDLKVMEFDCIQQAIKSQESRLKDRLIVIQIEPCDIKGIYRAPCIKIPPSAQEIDAMDETSFQQFINWEMCTRLPNTFRPPREYYRDLNENVNVELTIPIIIVLFVFLINFLSLTL